MKAQVHGTHLSPLLEHGLEDEVLLITYPVLLGIGKFFCGGHTSTRIRTYRTQAMPSGIVLNVYWVAGIVKTGQADQTRVNRADSKRLAWLIAILFIAAPARPYWPGGRFDT